MHISKLGIEPKEVPAYLELWDLVAPAEWEKGYLA